MTVTPLGTSQAEPPPSKTPRRAFQAVAWIVILVVVLLAMLSGPGASPAGDGRVTPIEDATLEMESRLVIAQEAVAPGSGSQALDQINQSPDVDRRIRLASIAAAIGGAEAGSDWVTAVRAELADRGVDPTARQAAEIDGLDRLFAGDASATVTADVEERLGWFGQIAVDAASADRADRLKPVVEQSVLMATVMVTSLVVLGLIGVAGLVLLVIYVVRAAQGLIPRAMAAARPWDGVYAETFAVWLILFQVLLLLSDVLDGGLPTDLQMAPAVVAFFLSLGALAWPVVRGIPWEDVRRDIGWTRGRGLRREIGCGIMGYAMAIPIVAVGLVITLVLILLFAPDAGAGSAAHPIVGEVAGGGWLIRAQVLVLASIAAPIVEETMFRGVLYRQVRTSAGMLPRGASVAVAVTATSLVFAMIHPQGVLAVPVLGAMAAAFALAREWRGSLVAAVVMHGMSNGIVMVMLMAIFS
ncbi:MAG: type II CAAX endopeptidase family protein [Phycisphaerales bacterium]|jgi:membrane protease YdiL (CAAX protease family)|nr:type II CAAX endopeptidase family protein [Phycisphaerales bacterium]